MRELIDISDGELEEFLGLTEARVYPKHAMLCEAGGVPDEIYFVCTGLLRVIVTDLDGNEHTVHFAMEGRFIADYSAFLQRIPGGYSIQALEKAEVIVLTRKSVEWGYAHLRNGDKLGRLVAEYYFIYNDLRIRNQYSLTPKQRYDNIGRIFPNIHNRVPQHMIASYLGISAVHLSRLKRQDALKK